MISDNLKFQELFNITEGKIDLHSRRFVLHSVNAFSQFRRELIENLDENSAHRIFTRFGFFSGQADAAAMKRIFKWNNIDELLKAGVRLLSMEGAAKMSVESLNSGTANGPFKMEILWRNSWEAEENIPEPGKLSSTSCWIFTGYASGYASFCMNRDIYFNETKCIAKGNRVCSATGMDAASWGKELDEITSHYKFEDIKSKVLILTRELKEKEAALEIQGKKLINLERNSPDFFIEVHSPVFIKTLDLSYRVARFDSSVLITGETGTGKEVLARYIHRNSPRSSGPFVAINCGALPETLLESELFGHKAGSFTGAISDRAGLFEEAHKGTIFLDEIGDISPAMQLKLLRVLQEREIMRIGENTVRKIDTRIIAATNRNLTDYVASGRFREDLLYRIRIIEIEVPPLRNRQEDILPLTRYFIKRFSKKLSIPGLRLDSTCVDFLQNYFWPGNIRELENVVERAAVLAIDGVILPVHLPSLLTRDAGAESPTRGALPLELNRIEESHIKSVLKLCGGNKTKAAKTLGISQATLWRKLKSFGKNL